VVVKVAIAYSADLDRALQILGECARNQPRVLAQPEPAAFVTGLGADGVELEVGFWIRDPEEGTLAVRSDISRDVLRRFAAEEIAIPFPQREVRLVPPDAAEAVRAAAAPAKGLITAIALNLTLVNHDGRYMVLRAGGLLLIACVRTPQPAFTRNPFTCICSNFSTVVCCNCRGGN
jgi:hypothetical protein